MASNPGLESNITDACGLTFLMLVILIWLRVVQGDVNCLEYWDCYLVRVGFWRTG